MKKKPTIKEVAKAANVSIATVSRILNDQEGFSLETKEKVMDAIDRLNYKRNDVARNLKVQETKSIAILLPTVQTSYYLNIIAGIEEYALKRGYTVILCNIGKSGVYASTYVNMLIQRQISGVIACSTQYAVDSMLEKAEIPSVFINTVPKEANFPYLKIDDRQAIENAVNYLVKQGHHKIALISGSEKDTEADKNRRSGYRDGCEKNKISLDTKRIVTARNFGHTAGGEAFLQLLKQTSDFTAVIASSDEAAAAILSIAKEKNIKIPEDLSLVGFNNSAIAEMLTPKLTTISLPFYQMGQEALESLIRQIEKDIPAESKTVQTNIVERESVIALT